MTYNLTLTSLDAYLKSAMFIAANILLPQLFHLIPGGGVMFLPVYFFTLIAAMRYGWQVALLTAVMTPVVGNLAFGAPMAVLIPDMLLKGATLSFAGFFASRYVENKFVASLLAVFCTWAIVGVIETPFTDVSFAFQDFATGLPGMAMMIVGSFLVNKYIK